MTSSMQLDSEHGFDTTLCYKHQLNPHSTIVSICFMPKFSRFCFLDNSKMLHTNKVSSYTYKLMLVPFLAETGLYSHVLSAHTTQHEHGESTSFIDLLKSTS